MASLRMLFLGVFTSNGFIRTIFLPVCYIVLFTPFLLAAGWYFGFGQTLQKHFPADFSFFDILPQIALSAVLVLLPTRLLSASGSATKGKDGDARKVPSLPYWIPLVRHLGSIMFAGEDWLKSIRESSIANIITYSAATSKHYVVLSTNMLDQLQLPKQWSSLEESRETKWAILQNGFSMPKSTHDQYFELDPTIKAIHKNELVSDEQRQSLISASLRALTESLPDFTTFNTSIVDQMQWERVANIELSDGTSESECDLFALVNEFCCNAILPTIVGAQFTESYQLLATDLATFNSKFWALSLGLPRLSPVRGLPGAALAQKRLLQNFKRLLQDLTSPPVRRVPDDDESVSGEEETDADIVTPVMKLNTLFMERDLPMDARAAIALQFVHDIIAEVVPVTLWTLLHIYSSPNSQAGKNLTLENIRKETGIWAQAFQPPSIHPSFPAPPEIRFTMKNILPSILGSRHLLSCINESRRMYGCPTSTYKVTKPIVLEEGSSIRSTEQEKWEIESGTYLDLGVSSSLVNSSEANYISANAFQPDRFLNSISAASIMASVHTTTTFNMSLISAIVAGIIQLWEIAPAPKKSFFDHLQEASAEASIGASALSGDQKEARSQAKKEKEIKDKKIGKWVLPEPVDGAMVKIPKTDIRVRIRRREGLPASKTIGRIG